jgi:hypothetical protein
VADEDEEDDDEDELLLELDDPPPEYPPPPPPPQAERSEVAPTPKSMARRVAAFSISSLPVILCVYYRYKPKAYLGREVSVKLKC